jgi:hypothetical protein
MSELAPFINGYGQQFGGSFSSTRYAAYQLGHFPGPEPIMAVASVYGLFFAALR